MPRKKFFFWKKTGKKSTLILLLLKFSFIAAAFGCLAVFGLFVYYAKDLPRPEDFNESPFTQTAKIYDRTGKVLLYDIYGEEKREVVPLSEAPESLKQAIIATEDDDFYSHFGIDFKSIARAILADLRLGQRAQGASTITQQLIRSALLARDKTISRKTREIILTLELERKYSKDEILGFYLNQVPFGINIYGVESAAQTYFNKNVSQLTIEEGAILAASIKSPSYFSPYGSHLDELLARKNYVLDRMAQEKYLSREEAEEIKTKEIFFAKPITKIRAPHFVMYVIDILKNKYGEEFIKEKGLRVYTSLNWDFQEWAEEAVEKGAKANTAYNSYNLSLTAVDPNSGEILAMVGSKGYFDESFPENCQPGKNCLFEPQPNVAIRNRQPGSAFKPFVYATAFLKGYDDKTVVIDEQTNFGSESDPYIPQNYDGQFRGAVTLRQALAQSLNIPAIKVLRDLAGLKDSIQTAKNMGITTLTKPASFYGLPLVLGGGEVKLLEITAAYGTFATGGLFASPVAIIKIEDSQGNIIEQNQKTAKRVLSSHVANLINSILSDNNARAPVFGLKSLLYFENYQVAAKTGTTQSYRDGWIIGYTPFISVGVWTGNNNNASMRKEPGIVLAGPVWRNFMEKALPLYPKKRFEEPSLY